MAVAVALVAVALVVVALVAAALVAVALVAAALVAVALVAEPREARMLARAYKSSASTSNDLAVRSRGSRARRISMMPNSDMRTAVCQPSPRAWSTRRLKAGSSSDRRAQLTGRRTHLAWLAQTSSALPVPHELARCQSLWHAVQH